MSKILTLALRSDVYDEIYRLSEKTGRSKNEIIRQVLEERFGLTEINSSHDQAHTEPDEVNKISVTSSETIPEDAKQNV